MSLLPPTPGSLKSVTPADGRPRELTQKEINRIWSKITVDGNGCWLWTGARFPTGYGRTDVQGSGFYTHRLMYMAFGGTIPEGWHTDHLCRNRACCNPAHLEAVTCRENIMRSPVAPAAINASKTHCKRGHPLVGANVETHAEGHRRCRICAITASRQRYAEATGAPICDAPISVDVPAEPRRSHGAAACAKGHTLDALNTYTDRRGYEHCRACRAAAQSRYEAKKKGPR